MEIAIGFRLSPQRKLNTDQIYWDGKWKSLNMDIELLQPSATTKIQLDSVALATIIHDGISLRKAEQLYYLRFTYQSDMFYNNITTIDSDLPKILAYLVILSRELQTTSLPLLIQRISNENPLRYKDAIKNSAYKLKVTYLLIVLLSQQSITTTVITTSGNMFQSIKLDIFPNQFTDIEIVNHYGEYCFTNTVLEIEEFA